MGNRNKIWLIDWLRCRIYYLFYSQPLEGNQVDLASLLGSCHDVSLYIQSMCKMEAVRCDLCLSERNPDDKWPFSNYLYNSFKVLVIEATNNIFTFDGNWLSSVTCNLPILHLPSCSLILQSPHSFSDSIVFKSWIKNGKSIPLFLWNYCV